MSPPVRRLIEGQPVLVVIAAHEAPGAALSRLIAAARRYAVPIVFAMPPDGTAAPSGWVPGAREYVIRPRRLSVFHGTELPVLLAELGADTVILAGGESNTAVHYSFLDAHQYDYFCRVAVDSVSGSSPRKHEAALQAMEYMQTGARRGSEEIIAAFGTLTAKAMRAPEAGTPLIVGKPALLVIDVQGDISAARHDPVRDFPMPHYEEYMQRVPALIAAARTCDIPIVYMQEIHHPSMIDFGRELDGFEKVHCLEDAPRTAIVPEVDRRPGDYWVRKRRYSSFFDTDLQILLRGLGARTLLMVGGFSDVCVHYAFADAHQRDYVCRVVEDCVAGSTLGAHEAALDAMDHLQPGSRVRRDDLIAGMTAWFAAGAV